MIRFLCWRIAYGYLRSLCSFVQSCCLFWLRFLFKQIFDVEALKLKTTGSEHLVRENWIKTLKNGSGIGCPLKIKLAILAFNVQFQYYTVHQPSNQSLDRYCSWCSCEGMLLRDSSTRSLLQKRHLSTPKQGTSHVDKIIVKSYLKRNDRKRVSKKHQQKPFLQGSAHGMGWDYLCYGFARRWNQVLLLEIHGDNWSPMISIQYTYLSPTSYHAIPPFPFYSSQPLAFSTPYRYNLKKQSR